MKLSATLIQSDVFRQKACGRSRFSHVVVAPSALGLVGLFLLLFGWPVGLIAQTLPTYQPVQMRADLARFTDALLRAHPDLHDSAARANFSRFADQLTTEVVAPLSSIDFHLVVMRLTAGLNDGHTGTFLSGPTDRYVREQRVLPLHVLVQNERIFVKRNLSNADFGAGSEILAIDGHLSNVILRRLSEHLGMDGGSQSGIAYWLSNSYQSFFSVFPLVFGFRPTYELTVRDSQTGRTIQVSIPAIDRGEFVRLELERFGATLHAPSWEGVVAQPPVELEIQGSAGYALLTVRRFFVDGFTEPETVFPAILRDAFRQLAEARTPRLIVDIRNNEGGIGANAAHLLSYLSDTTLTPTSQLWLRGNDAYYASIVPHNEGLDEWFGLRADQEGYLVTRSDAFGELRSFAPVNEYGFRGELIVLINGGTISAAGMAAGLLREYTDAVIVGEEAGGYAGMSNGIQRLTVNGELTDTNINIPLVRAQFAVPQYYRTRGVLPDHTVLASPSDLAAARDAALEFAKAWSPGGNP